MKRLHIALKTYVILEAYFAITSNTIQIGARIDARLSSHGATLSGYLEFDALVQYSPFYFAVDVAGGLAIEYLGVSLLSVRFSGSVEGPNPYRLKGSVSFSIFWWSVSKSVDETYGSQTPDQMSQVDPWPLLNDAFSRTIAGQQTCLHGHLPE